MITLLHGDCREILTTLPDKSVQCVVTSPPYYGLRKYSDDPREIGQEATPALYVQALVEVFHEVKRVLRDDGTCWINLGDSYSAGGRGGGGKQDTNKGSLGLGPFKVEGMADKQLLGIPWRVAFALQDDGWILRSDIIWAKPNCMPESVTDRPTRAHEYLFLFAKQARYSYDAAAIAEASTGQTGAAADFKRTTKDHVIPNQTAAQHRLERPSTADTGTRNRRTVWNIATQPVKLAHFATMPEALIEPCILAGSSAQACETCGAAWGRVVERESSKPTDAPTSHRDHRLKTDMDNGILSVRTADNGNSRPPRNASVIVTTLGFAPRCACAANTGSARSVVLDPFGGSGTVGRVAERYQRDAILIDLNQDYIDLQEQRTDKVQVEMFV